MLYTIYHFPFPFGFVDLQKSWLHPASKKEDSKISEKEIMGSVALPKKDKTVQNFIYC